MKIVFFVRLTFAQAWRAYGIRGLTSWLAGLVTAIAQWYTEGGYDGYYELCHVGVLLPNGVLFESMPGGVRCVDFNRRAEAYAGTIITVPIADRYCDRLSMRRVYWYVDRHLYDAYRWGGLPFAILQSLVGWQSPGAKFCSELVVDLLVNCGVVPASLPVVRGNRIAWATVQAQRYAPCEVARLPQLARNKMEVYRRGLD